MMPRVTFGVDQLQFPTVERQPVTVFGNIDAGRIDWANRSIGFTRLLDTINRFGARDEPAWIDHVRRTVTVHDATRVRQLLQ